MRYEEFRWGFDGFSQSLWRAWHVVNCKDAQPTSWDLVEPFLENGGDKSTERKAMLVLLHDLGTYRAPR
jgi:hypothetical protein